MLWLKVNGTFLSEVEIFFLSFWRKNTTFSFKIYGFWWNRIASIFEDFLLKDKNYVLQFISVQNVHENPQKCWPNRSESLVLGTASDVVFCVLQVWKVCALWLSLNCSISWFSFKKYVFKIDFSGDEYFFKQFRIFVLKQNPFKKKNTILKIQFYLLKVNCIGKLLRILVKSFKNMINHESS